MAHTSHIEFHGRRVWPEETAGAVFAQLEAVALDTGYVSRGRDKYSATLQLKEASGVQIYVVVNARELLAAAHALAQAIERDETK